MNYCRTFAHVQAVSFSKKLQQAFLTLKMYATRKNCKETARVFGRQDSTVRLIQTCKAAPPKKANKE